MGQRQGTPQTGTATARYQPYTSSLTVEGGGMGGASAGTSSGGGRMPSSASATPDHQHNHGHLRPPGGAQLAGRVRALSLGNFPAQASSSSTSVGGSTSRTQPMMMMMGGAMGGVSSPDSDDDSIEDGGGGLFGALTAVSSLPPSLAIYRDIKCPVCHKNIPTDSVEEHLVMCLTKPHIVYNEDILTEDKGECSICLDDLQQGDIIARLPCLCIYHKSCIDEWFAVNRSCPEHPGD